MKKSLPFIIFILLFSNQQIRAQLYNEPYRPQIHFSPKEHWMNDPNGMVYFNGTYHLFFQYYPGASVWGPMHWGHATSADLVHWKQQPIALYPDNIGYIFSGSVVVDSNNTSGFSMNGKPPLVAVFTQHDTSGEHAHITTFQNQSIAYSNDAGKTWTKYKSNPVLKNPGITDFRDPKVMWYDAGKKWVMTLAVKDHVSFYSSPDLKNWTKESDFGKDYGAHGGVWECPDLIYFNDGIKQVWVLLVSINPGAPNGGSAIQYFCGDFNGATFTPFNNKIKWIDYGPDDYAGVTWSNTNARKIFLGWMSNWNYAQVTPTQTWRSAMTIPRDLNLTRIDSDIYISSRPVEELNKIIIGKPQTLGDIYVDKKFNLSNQVRNFELPCRIDLVMPEAKTFSLVFSNEKNERLVIGYDEAQNQYYINRAKSGEADFEKSFNAERIAPRIAKTKNIKFTLIADVSSVELFADDGLSVMTAVYFPAATYNQLQLQSRDIVEIKNFTYAAFKTIW